MALDLAALKAALLAETDPEFVVHRTNGAVNLMADWLNQPSTFVVWKTSMTAKEMHNAYVWTEMDSFTNAGKQFQFNLMISTGEVNPSDANIRQGFQDIFSGSQFAQTRANLIALAKRFATRGEAILATGTGSDANPGTLVYEGNLSGAQVQQALYQT